MGRIPMSSSASLPPEVVVEQGRALRRLAAALLGEGADADDAAQEAWLRTLKAGPQRVDSLGAWLARVLRNLVATRRRDAARRSAIEREHARPELVDEGALRDREATLRSVVDAVASLDAPLKAVVLLRYFEQLEPREIAERLGLPRKIVYDRLERAHEKLRAGLEREFGSRRRWTSALAPFLAKLDTSPLVPTFPTGVPIVMAAKAQLIACAGAAALVAGIAWWAAGDRVGPAVAREDRAGHVLEPRGGSVEARTDPVAGGARDSVPAADTEPPVATRPWPAPQVEHELVVFVTDERDLPQAERTVYVGPAGGTLDEVGVTDADGRLAVTFKSFAPYVEVDVGLRSEGGGPLRRIALSGGRRAIAIRALEPQAGILEVAGVLGAHGTDGTDTVAAEAPQVLSTLAASRFVLAVGDERLGLSARSSPLSNAPRAVADAEGWLTFVEPALVGRAVAPASPGMAVPFSSPAVFNLHLRPLMLEGLVMTANREVPPFVVRGRVLDAGGEPVASAPVYSRVAGAAGWQETRCDAEGGYALELDPGEWELRAGGGRLGRAATRLSGLPGEALAWTARLDRGLELKVRLVDPDGRPLAGWRVEVAYDDALAPQVDGDFTDEHGRATVPNVPFGSMLVLARPNVGKAAPPATIAAAIGGGEEEVSIQVDLRAGGATGALRVELLEHGPQRPGAQVRVWREDSGRGAFLELAGETIREDERQTDYVLDGLIQGLYRVEILVPGCAPLAIPAVYVAAADETRIGPIEPEPGAWIEVQASGPDVWKGSLLQRTDAFELSSGPLEVPRGAKLPVRAGFYEQGEIRAGQIWSLESSGFGATPADER